MTTAFPEWLGKSADSVHASNKTQTKTDTEPNKFTEDKVDKDGSAEFSGVMSNDLEPKKARTINMAKENIVRDGLVHLI